MKSLLLTGILVLIAPALFAQNQTDSIEVKKILGPVFIQNGRYLTPRKLLEVTESNTEAYKEMQTAKINYDIGNAIGFAGGFLIGWPLGTAVFGGDPDWTLVIAGVGLSVVSIPFTLAYSRHAKNAVKIYNDGIKQTGMRKVDLKLGLICGGIGVKITL